MTPVPFEQLIWSGEEVAEYLRVSYPQLRDRLRHVPGFPAPIPEVRYANAGRQHRLPARWRAVDVTRWALGEAA